MKILVCGGRHFKDKDFVFSELDKLHEKHNITSVIEGGAHGADDLARQWALSKCLEVKTYKADWERYGESAKPIRDELMLEQNPDIELVVGFPGGKGTANMLHQAECYSIESVEIKYD